MEAFERQDYQAAIRENSMLLLYCCDPHYDLCFTIPSLPYTR
jgi:seryl-tRNA(Sec) selenium transferase